MSVTQHNNDDDSKLHESSTPQVHNANDNDIVDSLIDDEHEVDISAESINRSTFETWTVDEVINWCIQVLNIEKNNSLIINITSNGIGGDILKDLTFDDCKELSNDSLPQAIKFRIALNKLKENSQLDKELEEQGENMTVVLKNLYTSLNSTLQDYSNQYSKLRVELLDIIKNKSATSTQGSEGSQTEFFEVPKSQPTLTTHMTPNLSRRNTNSNRSLSPTTQTFQPTQLRNRSTSSLTAGAQQQQLVSGSAGKPKLVSTNSSATLGQSSNEPLKQLRDSKEDSCEKILKNAMKRHGLNDQDWRQYVLVICYGDQERPLHLDETPVTIFKTLKQQGLHPSIMLRRRGDFEELMVNGNHQSSNNINPGEFNTSNPTEYSATPGGRL